MVAVDDVADWFVDIVNSDGTLMTLVPGEFAAERAAELGSSPYGVFSVEQADAASFNSGFAYYPTFTISTNVYADQNTTADASAIQARLLYLMPRIPASAGLRGTGERVLNVTPIVASAKFAPVLRNANDVVVVKLGWKVECVGRTNLE